MVGAVSNNCSVFSRPSSDTLSVLGTLAILSGQPIIQKPFVLQGTSQKTSLASLLARKWFRGRLLTREYWAPTFHQLSKKSTKLSTIAGRLAPVIGWGLLLLDKGRHYVMSQTDSA